MINLIFLIYLLVVPLVGFIGYKKLPKSKLKWKIYSVIIVLSILIYFVGFDYSASIGNFIHNAIVCYMIFELIWMSIQIKNKVIKWIVSTSAVIIVFLIIGILFFGSIAGIRFFPAKKIISTYRGKVYSYEIIKTTRYDCGTSYSNYEYYIGIQWILLKYRKKEVYGGLNCRDCIDNVKWVKKKREINAELLSDGKVKKVL